MCKTGEVRVGDFVKSSTSVLRCILRHCGVPVSTPFFSGFARLEFEAFYFVVRFPTFYGTIKVEWMEDTARCEFTMR